MLRTFSKVNFGGLDRMKRYCSGISNVGSISAFVFVETVEESAPGVPEGSTVRSAAVRRSHLNLEKASSMGLKSGLYGGK